MSDPILLDFPDSFETERLIIRAPRPGEGRAVSAAVRASMKELRPWMDWAQEAPSVSDSEAHSRRAAARFRLREDLPLRLWRKDDGVFVGSSGLHRIDWSVPCMEIGYWVRSDMSGQGYITEAVIGITHFAFDQLGAQRLEIHCDARNTRSAAVAERAGYALEARLRHHRRDVHGQLCDTLIYVRFPER